MLEICEVQVFGCEPGKYGVNCTMTCSHCKTNVSCGIVKGECNDAGCAYPGYRTPYCKSCKPGMYGMTCSKKCDHCKNNASCGQVDGKCNDEGCAYPGYQKPYCQSCIDGKYGDGCNVTCSKFCKNKTCDRKTGACPDGCVAGYTGSRCDQKCNDGNYGQNCSKTCGHCSEGTCHYVNGACTGGCKAGYITELCNTACEQNRYGNDCINKCGMCLHDKCNHVNGTCVDGCENGYQGNLCKKPCDSGSYGNNCSKSCGQCSNDTCDHVNGTCTSECKAGYRTNLCNIRCSTGSYGKKCKQKCSKNCMDKEKCNPINGTCKKCADGFRGEKCDQSCSDGTYGLGCKFNCSVNCLDDTSCNKVNGTCTRCHPGWHNNFCSALQLVETGYAIAESSSVLGNYLASRTIDGNISQHSSYCLHTAATGETEAWLRVDLSKVFSIQSVKFWYRNDRISNYWNTKRLRGYSIRVSNDTVLPESSCYTDPGNVTLPTIIEKDCVRTTRYVWIYQNNTLDGDCPMLEICEVQVFGCETGIDKEQCQKPCTHCKDSSYCNPVSRSCNREGCAFPGYHAPLCQDCVDGHYGKNCEKNCSVFCKNQSCERSTGNCTYGCKWGYTGSHCNQTCEPGGYGQNCNETCGHCLQNPCDHVTGTCTEGCKAGYKTALCKTSCDAGEYGKNCKYNCSGNCLYRKVCDPQNGTCQSCAGGFKGEKCDQKCGKGTYGLNCSEDCGACLNGTDCHHMTGECPSGCEQGWMATEKCDNGCIDGRYGNNCGKNCSMFCMDQTCQQTTGICAYGCLKGYTGGRCNQTCEYGKYGQNCSETCGKCFKNTCNHVNGTCAEGCAAGFMPELCNTSCKDGQYGRDCRFNCSGHCLSERVCEKENGTCESCAKGYQGRRCDKRCENGKYGLDCKETCGACFNDTACDHETGSCCSGCKTGWYQTDKCDKACSDGSYGDNCTNKCSENCFQMTMCNKVSGTCGKCKAGWDSNFCNETCKKGVYGQDCRVPCGACNGDCLPTNGSCPGGCRTGFVGEKCNVRHLEITAPSEYSYEGGASGSIVAALSVLIAILILLIILIFAVWRKRFREKEREHIPLQNVAKSDDEADRNQEQDDEPITNSKCIKITDLPEAIISLARDSNKGFQEEFQAIPYGEQPEIPCTIGKLPENVPKNRFKTTFPYDHSRVVLLESKKGDYINANYIKNAASEVAYIASQGPKPNTIVDFWKMVWQENVYVIVMVTNLKEGRKLKCERYWPHSSTSNMTKEHFILRLTSEKTYANFVVHNIEIINREIHETRHVTHLQYTAWPDHGTPTPLELLVFYHYVSKAKDIYPENKLLVHCSAGIGRTGTFIALDALHRQGQKTGRINIVDYVHTMREDRMNMIQNASQYGFLYEVLNQSFRTKSYITAKNIFVQEVESTKDKAVNLSNFKKEFQELDCLRPVFSEDDTSVAKTQQKFNMTQNVLPADSMRVILTSYVAGRDTYYNAVPVSSFTTKDCIISAQYPVPGTSVDLIRLLVDHDCSILVSINPLSGIPSSKEWFKKNILQGYSVEVKQAGKLSENVFKSTMSVKAPSRDNWHKVSVFQVTTWMPTQNLPSDVHAIVDAVRFVQSNETIDPEHKMVVLSRDGASGCGVFCAVYNALQQLQQDDEVDLFTIVRLLQSRRPQMISDMNEYFFCCRALAELVNSGAENLYTNSASARAHEEENLYANT
nr:neurogenic locus notch homolog protein 1-like isoform X2 [Crassostrea virginica]